jgi:hypothetical protein
VLKLAKSTPLEASKRFEKLWDAYAYNRQSYVANVMATITALMLGLGWIVGSSDARATIAATAPTRVTVLVVLGTVLVVHAVISISLYRSSSSYIDIFRQYDDLSPLSADEYAIPGWLLVANLILVACLLSLVGIVIFYGAGPDGITSEAILG